MGGNRINTAILNETTNTTNINSKTKDEQELYYWLLLNFTAGVGYKTAMKLLQFFKNIQDIFVADFLTLADVTNDKIAKSILNQDAKARVEKTLLFLEQVQYKTHIITPSSILYPDMLANIFNPPLILYASGNIELLNKDKIAIIGTRTPTRGGIENAMFFSKELAKLNYTIVSGVALGIDRYAHLGAINEIGSTIGVIGTGVDVRYPIINSDVYDKLLQNKGLILSEYNFGTKPSTHNFPRRNRIIAGLSKACLVVESALDGGSMITANCALEMGREIFAIPGSIHNKFSKGCHKLIKSGAKLVENLNDILEEINSHGHHTLLNKVSNQSFIQSAAASYLNIQNNKSYNRSDQLEQNTDKNNQPYNIPNETSIEMQILNLIGFEPINIDELTLLLKQDFSDLCATILELELSGKLINCGNGYYQRILSN